MCVLCVVAQWYMVPSVIKEGRTVSFYLIFFFVRDEGVARPNISWRTGECTILKKGMGYPFFPYKFI